MWKLALILGVLAATGGADDLSQAAGQILSNILPSLISNNANRDSQGNAANTIQQIGTVVGGVVDYTKKKSYEDLLKQVADATTDEDLLRLSEEMFNNDYNNAAGYIQVAPQGKTTAMSANDEAPENLLRVPDTVWNGPTIRPFVALFDNYHKNVIRPEFATPNDDNEQNIFLNTVLATGPIRSLIAHAVNKGVNQMNDYNEQVTLLKKMWFTKYARHWTGLCKCSCAFENIFLAELKGNEVLGLHSWLFFAKREQDHKANYLGYMDKLELAGKGSILKFHAVLSDTKDKPDDTMFVGTSPELELALYTLCFMARPDRPCRLGYKEARFTIYTKSLRSDGMLLLDTGYPNFAPYG